MKQFLILLFLLANYHACSNLTKKKIHSCRDPELNKIQRKKPKTRPIAGTRVNFCAKVLYVGNEPLAALVLRDKQNRSFYIRKNAIYEKLLKQQYKTFYIQGTYYPTSILLPQADGSIAVEEIQEMNSN